jgi:type I restriction enzyme S subunit
MQAVVRRLTHFKTTERWDFGFHDPAYTALVQSLDSRYPTIRFGDIITLMTDMGAFSLYKTEYFVDEGIPFLRVPNVQEYGVDLTRDTKYISREYHEQLEKSQLRPDDLLLTTKAVIGVAAVVDESLGECNMSQNLVRIRLADGINPGYLAVFLNSRLGRTQTETASTGPNQKYLNFGRIRDLIITLPPRPVQDQIAAVMQGAYAARRATLAEAEALLGGIDGYVLGELGIDLLHAPDEKRFVVDAAELLNGRLDIDYYLPKLKAQYKAVRDGVYPTVELGSLISEMSGGATPLGAKYLDEGIPFLRIQNITEAGIDLSDVRYISQDTNREMKRSQTQPGDLLMTITGRVGTAAVVPPSLLEANTNQHMVIIRLKSEKVTSQYLAAVINSSAVAFQAQRHTTGTTRVALDYKSIRSLLIPIPPLEVQDSIVAAVQNRQDSAEHLRVEAQEVVSRAKERVERIILGEEDVG